MTVTIVRGEVYLNMGVALLQHLKDEDNVDKILGFLQIKACVTGFASITTCTISASAAKPRVKTSLQPTCFLQSR